MRGLQDWLLTNNDNPASGLQEVDHLWSTFQDPSPEHRHQLIPFLEQQNFDFDNWDRGASTCPSSSCSSSAFDTINRMSVSLSHHLETRIDMQTQEFDHFLHLQIESLRCALQEQSKLHLSTLTKTIESKVLSLIRQKDEKLVQAIKKGVELEACLRKAQLERDSWETLARKKGAMVIDLSNTLEQVKDGPVPVTGSNKGEGESCCSSSLYERKEKSQNDMMRMACKSCNFRGCCVLFLPCRHLCSCTSCEAYLVSCPVCNVTKQAIMEVFLV